MKYILIFVALISVISCSVKVDPDITVKDLKTSIEYLASDSLKGRKAGEEGDRLAAEFVKEQFANAGLELLYDDGFQSFDIVTEVELGEGNSFKVEDTDYTVETDFSPYSFSANTSVSGDVVFAGYGFNFTDDSISWNDYKDLDVEGKWVLVLKGDPEMDVSESIFIRYSDERSKVLVASDNKAAGIILTGGPVFDSSDELSPVFYDKNSSEYSIPVIQVTRKVADEILKKLGKTVAELEEKLNETRKSESFDTETTVSVHVNVVQKQVQTMNVVGLLPGTDPVLKDEYVIIGAHHDHLGFGGPGSGSRALDTIAIHNGADDNASGVAAVIELAEKMASLKEHKRSIIFATFGAEEMGLIGSRAFTADPPVDLDKVSAMFNFDMVGRLDTTSNSLSIGGIGTAEEIKPLLEKYNPGFELALSEEGTGPSDHSSFYLQGIPVFFISTGAHSDYHTPLDDADRINYKGAADVIKYADELVTDVVNRDNKLTYKEAGSVQRSGRGARYKVTLGIMPDFAGAEKRGLRVDAVTKGKPAEKGGMKKGDIVTSINGLKVGNIYDYMNRLNTLEAGANITVDVLRDDKEVVLIIQL
ncbi:MAG: M20/M25/M40 family metallo-hydrolase [Prolixibacteraceae bacterium]|nr:M20/M25/M40 family metallo-hydrolase [Prolixibacteraceae bacterium]